MVAIAMSKIIRILLCVFYIAVICFNAWTTLHSIHSHNLFTGAVGFICLVLSIGCGHSFFKLQLLRAGIIKGKPPVIKMALKVDSGAGSAKMAKALVTYLDGKTDCRVDAFNDSEEFSILILCMILASLADGAGEKELSDVINEWLKKHEIKSHRLAAKKENKIS